MTGPDIEPRPTPEELLRAMLHIAPEDAAEVRKIADVKAKPDAALDDTKPE